MGTRPSAEHSRKSQFGVQPTDSCTCRLVMPIPYLLPPKRYSSTDVPWCVDVEYCGVDSLGRSIDDPVQSFYGHVQSPD